MAPMSRPWLLGVVALACASMGLLGSSAVASAKIHAGCHRIHRCTTGSGPPAAGAVATLFTLKVHPDPVVETPITPASRH